MSETNFAYCCADPIFDFPSDEFQTLTCKNCGTMQRYGLFIGGIVKPPTDVKVLQFIGEHHGPIILTRESK